MFTEVHTPAQLLPQELDAYLTRGWFRMGQTIFTTNFINFHDQLYSTIWLRIVLEKYTAESTQVKLFRQNSMFDVLIRPAMITAEKEELYQRYRDSLSFEPSETLPHLLFGMADGDSIYNTLEVAVYDDDQLIACGFFDIGETSAAGISSFYDPAYKKYSLGKFLIYQKIQYCKDKGLRYFYPGYFVPGYSFFDYKLTIGKKALEFLKLIKQLWLPIHHFSDQQIPYKVMCEKLIGAQQILRTSHFDFRLLNYQFFDANLIPDLRDTGLLDFPVFLFLGSPTDQSIPPVIVYDVRDERYHVLSCSPMWKPNRTNPDENFYSEFFISNNYEIYATAREEELVMVFKSLEKSVTSL